MGEADEGSTRLAIADTVDALTPAWLTDALRLNGHLVDGSVTGVHVSPVGTGQMCDSVRLGLTYDQPVAAPATLIAKLPATDDTSRSTARALGSYENEVRFYQQLAGDLPVSTPGVYHADIEVEAASFVLLLEDLAPARQGDQLTGCSVETAVVAVDELVGLHAPRWGDSTLASLPWLHRDPTMSRQFMLTMLPVFWEGFCQRYAAQLARSTLLAGGALFVNLEAYLMADSRPWSIRHGDYRLDNLLLDPEPGGRPISVVDWQTVSHGPALDDVAYFIGAGLLAGARREAEEDLVRGYHRNLVAAGVTDYRWERCWDDYRRGAWAGLVMAVAASMLVEHTDRGDQMFMTMAERHACHALDLDADEVIGA